MRQLFFVTCVYAVCVSPAFAQQTSQDPPAAQTSTAQTPQTNALGRLEAGAEWIQNLFGSQKPKTGFYAEFGGLPPGSGISAGPAIDIAVGGNVVSMLRGRLVVAGSSAGECGLTRLAASASASGKVKPQDHRSGYFGIGPNAWKPTAANTDSRTPDYRGFRVGVARTGLTVGRRVRLIITVTTRAAPVADTLRRRSCLHATARACSTPRV